VPKHLQSDHDQLLHDLLNTINAITAQCELLEAAGQSNDRVGRIYKAALEMAKAINAHRTGATRGLAASD